MRRCARRAWSLVYNLAFKALMLTVLLPIWVVLFLLFRPDFSGVTLQGLLLAVPAIMIGFGISFLFGAIITCVAFWTTRVYALNEFYYALSLLFSGIFVPLDLLPSFLRPIAGLLPFQLYVYIPVQLILGQLTPVAIGRAFVVGLVWLGVALLLFRLIWRSGVRRFSAVGA